MKRILIVGASSFIGSNLAVALRKHYRVFGTYHRHRLQIDGVLGLRFPIVPGTLFRGLLHLSRPDIIIYCAAETDEKRCRQYPLESLFLNGEAPAELALAAKHECAVPPRLIYLSTSKVFSGDKGQYGEDDRPDGKSSYGRSKLYGEEGVGRYENAYILRLATLFGLSASGQNSMFNRLLQSLWHEKQTSLIQDEYRSFLSIDDFCRAMELLIETRVPPGTFHLGNKIRESYFQFGEHVTRIFGISSKHLLGISGKSFTGQGFGPEDRGHDLSLSGDLFEETFEFHPKDTEFSLRLIQHRLQKGSQ